MYFVRSRDKVFALFARRKLCVIEKRSFRVYIYMFVCTNIDAE